jgi:hypothetical protein
MKILRRTSGCLTCAAARVLVRHLPPLSFAISNSTKHTTQRGIRRSAYWLHGAQNGRTAYSQRLRTLGRTYSIRIFLYLWAGPCMRRAHGGHRGPPGPPCSSAPAGEHLGERWRTSRRRAGPTRAARCSPAAQRRTPPSSPARPASRSHAPVLPQPCSRRRRLLAIVPLRPVHASYSAPPLRRLLRLCELAAARAQRITTPPRHTPAGRTRHHTPRPTMRTALCSWPCPVCSCGGRRRGVATQAEGHARAAGTRGAARGRRAPRADLGERSHVGCQTIGQQVPPTLLPSGGILDISTGRTRMLGLQKREKPAE